MGNHWGQSVSVFFSASKLYRRASKARPDTITETTRDLITSQAQYNPWNDTILNKYYRVTIRDSTTIGASQLVDAVSTGTTFSTFHTVTPEIESDILYIIAKYPESLHEALLWNNRTGFSVFFLACCNPQISTGLLKELVRHGSDPFHEYFMYLSQAYTLMEDYQLLKMIGDARVADLRKLYLELEICVMR
jgi:hypothetical protein